MKKDVIVTTNNDINFKMPNVFSPNNDGYKDILLSNGDNWVLFYALGGDTRSDLRNKILLSHFDQNTTEGEIQLLPTGTDLSLVYFFDADKEGIETRIQKWP